jgi:hypothetical protein
MKTYFIYPAGNPTILVDNLEKNILRENYAEISNKLLKNYSNYEQV